MWNLKYGINEPIYKTGKEQTCSCQAGVREGEEWAGRLVHPPEDAENESQEIALQKRKDRRRFRSLDSKRRRGG